MSELENKIKKWLEKEGYPFEMEVAQAFERAGFSVELSTYYKDFDSLKYREIDVVATKYCFADEDKKLWFRVNFICECKHSINKPWVLFSSHNFREKYKDDASIYRHANLHGHVALLALSIEGVARKNKLLMHRENCGFGLVRALDGQSDVAYKAIMSACRAAASMGKEKDGINKSRDVELYFPVVITTGKLFQCELDESLTPELKEIQDGSLIFKNPSSGESLSTIDIVTHSGLDEYLAERAEWTNDLLKTVTNGVEPLRKYLKNSRPGID